MVLRILVDENTSPRIVAYLDDADHEAVHVVDALEGGASDEEIAAFAAREGYAILTHDSDFLTEDYAEQARVLHYDDDTMPTEELARKLIRLGTAVRSNDDLADVTYLGTW
jgi:predicted nuclease of predicted toxin-antitoxin system